MPNVCILTDSTAQFVQPHFLGYERVYLVPFVLKSTASIEPLGAAGAQNTEAHLSPAPADEFLRQYSLLSQKYDSILVMVQSSWLTSMMENARLASEKFSNHCCVAVVDSQSVGLGLGWLVELAAGAAAQGESLDEIERKVRVAVPQIYIYFCIPELMYLAKAGLMESSQAMAGEIMSMLPIFTLEEGRLVPTEKVRTPRHLFEAFQDFLAEFEAPVHVALVHGPSHSSLRIRPLRQYLQEFFPNTPFTEHPLSAHLAALFGPESIGLIVSDLEK